MGVCGCRSHAERAQKEDEMNELIITLNHETLLYDAYVMMLNGDQIAEDEVHPERALELLRVYFNSMDFEWRIEFDYPHTRYVFRPI